MNSKIKKIICFIFTIFMLVFVFWEVDFKVFFSTLCNLNLLFLPFWLILFVFAVYLRGLRWHLILNDVVKNETNFNLGLVFNFGNMLNVFLPLRAGDFWRAYFIAKKHSLKKMHIFGSIILERIFDGMSVVLMMLFSMLVLLKNERFIVNIAIMAFCLFFGSFFLFFILCRNNNFEKIFQFLYRITKNEFLKKCFTKIHFHFQNFLNAFLDICNIKKIGLFLLSSIFIWILEASFVFLAVKAFGFEFTFIASFLVISLIAFSTMIPSTSVMVGPYQLAYIIGLGFFSINKTDALCISLLVQACALLVATVLSFWFVYNNGLDIKNISKENLQKEKVLYE